MYLILGTDFPFPPITFVTDTGDVVKLLFRRSVRSICSISYIQKQLTIVWIKPPDLQLSACLNFLRMLKDWFWWKQDLHAALAKTPICFSGSRRRMQKGSDTEDWLIRYWGWDFASGSRCFEDFYFQVTLLKSPKKSSRACSLLVFLKSLLLRRSPGVAKKLGSPNGHPLEILVYYQKHLWYFKTAKKCSVVLFVIFNLLLWAKPKRTIFTHRDTWQMRNLAEERMSVIAGLRRMRILS